MKGFAKTLGTAILGGLITIGGYKYLGEDKTVIIEKPAQSIGKVAKFSNSNDGISIDFSGTAEVVTPAVVHITSTVTGKSNPQAQQVPPMFRYFFEDENMGRSPQPRQGSGSGVIISEDGYIVTNNHVVEDADVLEVSLYDKRKYSAKVIGTDPSTDLALIKIDEDNLPKIPFGNSDDVKVGQWALAVGNPFNLESTVTAGIVSAKGRSLRILGGGSSIESFIQTDAAVNPGNSGGALVNLNGELIGINTAIASPTGAYSGYSFAVPANLANKVVEDLIKYGTVQRAFMGISILNITDPGIEQLGQKHGVDFSELEISQGVYVADLAEGGSAVDAGIKPGDIITEIDGRVINSVPELQEIIGGHRPGDEVKVTFIRKGSKKTLTVPLKTQTGETKLVSAPKSEVMQSIGAEFEEVSKEEADKFDIEGGLKIKRMYAGTLRAQTGIREGFIITKVNKEPIRTVKELEKILENERGGVLIEGINPTSGKKEYYGFGM